MKSIKELVEEMNIKRINFQGDTLRESLDAAAKFCSKVRRKGGVVMRITYELEKLEFHEVLVEYLADESIS